MVMCVMCHRKVDEDNTHKVVLTEAEKQVLLNQGAEAPDQLLYCLPCWKTMADPVAASAVIRGVFEMGLRRLGVSDIDAKRRADLYHEWLVKQASKPRS